MALAIPGRVAALADLPEPAVDQLVPLMHRRTYRKGARLFTQGEDPTAIYFVEQGRVKWYKLSEDGIEHTLQVVERGEAVGLVALLDRHPYVATAEALEETTAWVLSVIDFDQVVIQHPEVALLVMRLLGDSVRWLIEHVHTMTNRSAQERVASVLLRKAVPVEGGLKVIPLTHQEIANLAGMARETVSRVLAGLQRRGAVRLTRSNIILLDGRRLWPSQGSERLG